MIVLKSDKEIDRMRISSQVGARVLAELISLVKPGITTLELDRKAEWLINKMGGKPAFKGYLGYPYTLCTSVNEEVVHGLPRMRRLEEGDIISLDVGVCSDGFYGDSAITVGVGWISPEAKKLLRVTEEALYKGIEQARIGERLSNISHAVQKHVELNGFSVVKQFVGHGIGKSPHEEPQIPNFGLPGRGVKLKRGMVLAIEPMVNLGDGEVIVLADGWTAVSKDRSLSAHFEHTVALGSNGTEILTKVN